MDRNHDEDVRLKLDRVEARGRAVLTHASHQAAMRRTLVHTLWALPAAPVVLCLVTLRARHLSVLILIGLAMAIPCGVFIYAYLHYRLGKRPTRAEVFAFLDHYFGSKERLSAADQFLTQDRIGGFQKAAIADAAKILDIALTAPIRLEVPARKPSWVGYAVALISVLIIPVVLCRQMPGLSTPISAGSSRPGYNAQAEAVSAVKEVDASQAAPAHKADAPGLLASLQSRLGDLLGVKAENTHSEGRPGQTGAGQGAASAKQAEKEAQSKSGAMHGATIASAAPSPQTGKGQADVQMTSNPQEAAGADSREMASPNLKMDVRQLSATPPGQTPGAKQPTPPEENKGNHPSQPSRKQKGDKSAVNGGVKVGHVAAQK